MNRIPVEIDLNEWEKFGGGVTADSYYKKDDDTIMLKLYADFLPVDEGYRELTTSENIASLGITIAKPIQYVKAGNQYGAIFERVKDKRSFGRIIADEPERIDEIARRFADMLNNLHSIPCNTELFPSMADVIEKNIKSCKYINESQREKALEALYSVPKATTCLHGDSHIGNAIMAEGKEPMFIDFSDFSYGNPIFDLGTLYYTTHLGDEARTMEIYHTHVEQMLEFWESFVKYFFEGEGLEEVNKKILPFAGFRVIIIINKHNEVLPVWAAMIKEAFGE